MYTFKMSYADGNGIIVEHVNEAIVRYSSGNQIVNGKALLTAFFENNRAFLLKSDKETCTIKTDGIRAIRVTKED